MCWRRPPSSSRTGCIHATRRFWTTALGQASPGSALEHKNQKLEGQYKDEVKQSESLREEMNGIKQTKKETEEKLEKWLRDIDVVC